jgi:hypothetical protein
MLFPLRVLLRWFLHFPCLPLLTLLEFRGPNTYDEHYHELWNFLSAMTPDSKCSRIALSLVGIAEERDMPNRHI